MIICCYSSIYANLFSSSKTQVHFPYFLFAFFYGFEGHLATLASCFCQSRKRKLIGYRILRPSDLALWMCQNSPVVKMCVFMSLFLRFRFMYVCMISLRSLMQPLSQLEPSLLEPIAALHTTPCSCLDQWVTCMSNSPLEHTHTHPQTHGHYFQSPLLLVCAFMSYSTTHSHTHNSTRPWMTNASFCTALWLLACLYRRTLWYRA